jgi:hypothetical protein
MLLDNQKIETCTVHNPVPVGARQDEIRPLVGVDQVATAPVPARGQVCSLSRTGYEPVLRKPSLSI